MYEIIMAPARSRVITTAVIIAAALILWFGLTAIATPFDHDESQYIAGAYFSGRLMIFRDFLYLQPPLHAWTFAPLAWLFPAHMVLAMRLATAVIALCVIAILWIAQRVAGISRDSAAIATLLMAATAAFQFSASVVRNDMLSTLMASMAILVTLLALRHGHARYWVAAGLFFGLAIATKLSFAPLALAVGLFALTSGGRCGFKAACRLAAGGLAGIMPMALGWALAPDAFAYGVVAFAATGPFAWYASNGAGDEMGMLEKLADMTKYLASGPALAALILLAVNAYVTRGRVRSPGRRLALWLVAGGLVGALLPTPSHVQYIMPLLPPLALGLGYLFDDARQWRPVAREAMLGLLCLSAIPGLLSVSRDVANMRYMGSPILESGSAARWAGDTVRSLSPDDEIVTLSPHEIIDSGLELDPRFAAGPFVYRTGWTMTQAQARGIKAMIPANLKDLDRDPPDAILVGYENGTRKLPLRPDDGLIAYARHRAYRMIAMPDGVGQLYVRKRAPRLPLPTRQQLTVRPFSRIRAT